MDRAGLREIIGVLIMRQMNELAAILMILLGFIVPAESVDLRPGDIVTVLPKDAIPAIMSPSFEEAGKVSWLRGDSPVVGVSIGGESRAYPIPILSRHEIVNDKFGGIPFAVTW
jgi:hypothetical protein